jgi:hypothetical protein
MIFLVPLAVVALLSGCNEGCERAGYTAMTVALVQGAPASASFPGGCAIYTDLPVDTQNPDQHGEALRHIGASVYECLVGASRNVTTLGAPAFYSEQLWFRIDGDCPDARHYGCFDFKCRTINTDLAHIGPQAVCPAGAPMPAWTEACWTQFYTVLGHEVMHGWLGAFHQ